jgi:hypothetical protein
MPDIKIDRLALKLSGLSDSGARHLAMRVADGLAKADLNPRAAQQPNIGITITASDQPDPEKLADQVVREVIRQIERVS